MNTKNIIFTVLSFCASGAIVSYIPMDWPVVGFLFYWVIFYLLLKLCLWLVFFDGMDDSSIGIDECQPSSYVD